MNQILYPRRCRGTHYVCVCTYHQNVKLMLAPMNSPIDYRQIMELCVCNLDSNFLPGRKCLKIKTKMVQSPCIFAVNHIHIFICTCLLFLSMNHFACHFVSPCEVSEGIVCLCLCQQIFCLFV